MIRTIFKFAIFLLIVHALVRFVPPYWRHHQFERALKDASLAWNRPDDEDVVQSVLTLAAGHDVPIGREHISIRRAPEHLYLDIAYSVPVEWIPSNPQPWRFTTHVDAWVLRPPNVPGKWDR